MAEEVKVFHPLLPAFKERMRIFHTAEDTNLSRMLEGSQRAIKRLIGDDDLTHQEVAELILERSRYVYNDQVEFFYENFKADILGIALDKMEVVKADDQS